MDLERQSFLGPNSSYDLGNVGVGIVGLGGGGSHVAQQLAHVGVGRFTVFDPDVVELSNLNRLVGATFEDALKKVPKPIVAERVVMNINPQARVSTILNTWQNCR